MKFKRKVYWCMKEKTMLDLALTDYNAAVILFNNLKNASDESLINMASYHIEQAVEKTIKFLIENDGYEYPRTHNIETLISFADENGVDLMLNDYIIDHAEMFSSWEAKTRYLLDYLVDIKKVETAIDEVDQYLDTVMESISKESTDTLESSKNLSL